MDGASKPSMDSSIEAGLETHLKETQSTLTEIRECLEDDDDGDKTELLKLKEELEATVQETEAALLQIKKERILERFKVKHPAARLHCSVLSVQADEDVSSQSSTEQSTLDDGRCSAS